MSNEHEPWDAERIRKGLAHLSEGPDSKLGIYIVQLFQRHVIALEEIAQQGRPELVTLMRAPVAGEDIEKFHNDALGMAFTDKYKLCPSCGSTSDAHAITCKIAQA